MRNISIFLLVIILFLTGCASGAKQVDKARELYNQKEFSQAMEKLDKYLEKTIDDPEAHVLRAQVNLALEDYENARLDCERAIAIDENYADAHAWMAMALWKLGYPTEGFMAVQHSIRIKPENPEALLIRGMMNLQIRSLEHAATDINDAIRLDPEYMDAYLSRSALYNMVGKTNEAIADLDIVLKNQPKNIEAYKMRSPLLALAGKFQPAIDDINTIIELGHNSPELMISRGRYKHHLGDMEGALADHNKAIEMGGAEVAAYLSRGSVYRERGKMVEAIADYNHVLEKDKNHADAYFYRAMAYFQKGDIENATNDARKAVNLRKEDPVFWGFAAVINLYRGRPDDALLMFKNAVKFDPNEKQRIANGTHIKNWIKQNPEKAPEVIKELNKIIEPYSLTIQ